MVCKVRSHSLLYAQNVIWTHLEADHWRVIFCIINIIMTNHYEVQDKKINYLIVLQISSFLKFKDEPCNIFPVLCDFSNAAPGFGHNL